MIVATLILSPRISPHITGHHPVFSPHYSFECGPHTGNARNTLNQMTVRSIEMLHQSALGASNQDGEDVETIAAANWKRVDIIPSYYGGDGALVDAAVQCGASGLISAGFGAGRAGPGYNQAFDHAIEQGVCVVQAARGQGRVLAYSGLSDRRIIAADDLTPWKARILLQLALTQTNHLATIQEMFQIY